MVDPHARPLPQQRPNPGADHCIPAAPNRGKSALPARLPGRQRASEDRRRAAVQERRNHTTQTVGVSQKAVQSATLRLRQEPPSVKQPANASVRPFPVVQQRSADGRLAPTAVVPETSCELVSSTRSGRSMRCRNRGIRTSRFRPKIEDFRFVILGTCGLRSRDQLIDYKFENICQ